MSPKSNARFGALATGLAIASAVIVPAGSVNAAEGDTVRISVDSAGNQGNGASFSSDSISSDGHYVAFESMASNLVTGDTNDTQDVFLHDAATGATVLVSVDSAGNQGNGISAISAVSPDGRYVAFQSDATNLVPNDTNSATDVFLHDTITGNTMRVSVDSAGMQANGESSRASVSSGGRYVSFQSDATNLVANDTNETTDVFVHDTVNGDTTRVSVDSAGNQVEGDPDLSYSIYPSITPDGRYVLFTSKASNLVVGDAGTGADVFVHDRTTGTTIRVSTNGDGLGTSISADGRNVAFESESANLVAGDTNRRLDAFVHDIVTGTTTRISVDSWGTQGNGDSQNATLAADGRSVIFDSGASNLVAHDNNDRWDVFVHDMVMDTTSRVSIDGAGRQANGNSLYPAISGDGRYVSFRSAASNLVPNDTNNESDVFVHEYARPALPGDRFVDINGSVFENAINAIARAGITSGCNPPANNRFCPNRAITRGEMAAFLARALHLPRVWPSTKDYFTDDDGSVFQDAINSLAQAGITNGCNPQLTGELYCPERRMTRGEMAAMLNRAFQFPWPQPDRFTDDTGHMFEPAINLIAAAKITLGCNPPVNDRFCPNDHVTRGQMAAFLTRALKLPS